MTERHARSGASNATAPKTKCPLCGARALFSVKNPFRPFCSEACRNRDLVAWASDQYQVPGPIADPETIHELDQTKSDRDDESYL